MTYADLPVQGDLHSDIHFGIEKRDVSQIVYKGVERRRQDVFWVHTGLTGAMASLELHY